MSFKTLNERSSINMNKHLIFIGLFWSIFGIVSCNKSQNNIISTQINEPSISKKINSEFGSTLVENKNLTTFIPDDYIIIDQIYGDLNKDGVEDIVLLIKATDKSNIVQDEYRGEQDRNRRGIIILLNKEGVYEEAVKNVDCFSSENEDGGVYFAPDLFIEISKGNLYIGYDHGRYGSWNYTFRYQNLDFELIGFDASERHGPVVLNETSINFLTKKKIFQRNTFENEEEEEEVFSTEVTKINIFNLIKLSEIEDFDNLKIAQ